jgi:hypothetical protein
VEPAGTVLFAIADIRIAFLSERGWLDRTLEIVKRLDKRVAYVNHRARWSTGPERAAPRRLLDPEVAPGRLRRGDWPDGDQ